MLPLIVVFPLLFLRFCVFVHFVQMEIIIIIIQNITKLSQTIYVISIRSCVQLFGAFCVLTDTKVEVNSAK